ncbi:DUF167 family protein [Sphingomonas xinjiangensis]|uniref:UPF0235 protein FHT02_002629 n=1 Tax=Sphingomonas xinjiangensis TaxID=643568 RepID=A0A840YGG6_9SPHN|nr:hypothetical protein [Sphingomonas xinjiangensis]
MPAWRGSADAIEITVRVTPRASRDVLAAGTADHFAARLAARPVEGAANTALVALVAKQFGVSRRAVTLLAGETSRLKRLAITGDVAMLEQIARSLYGMGHDG